MHPELPCVCCVQWLQRRSKWIKDSAKVDALYEAAHERNASRIFATICALEGLWVSATTGF